MTDVYIALRLLLLRTIVGLLVSHHMFSVVTDIYLDLMSLWTWLLALIGWSPVDGSRYGTSPSEDVWNVISQKSHAY